jgi:heterodisulfide reductase subunit A
MPKRTGKTSVKRPRRTGRRKRAKPGPKKGGIGIVIAQCEGDLSRSLDMEALVGRIKRNPRVGPVRVETYPCTRREVEDIAAWLADQQVSRVVVAGCSERLYGRFYRDALERAGIDPSLVGFANIRDHGVLVHRGSRRLATSCSADLIDIAVASVAGASPKERMEAEVKPVCLVIGAGVAGISSVTALASRGVKVIAIDKAAVVGGLLNRLNIVFPSYTPAGDFLASQAEHLKAASIEVKLGVEPVALKGCVGDFAVDLSDGSTVAAGAIIVATGADLLRPDGLFGYGEKDGVLTQVEFEAIMKSGEDPGSNIVMIQCAGSRNEERPYCSRICCTASIKNAILIKQKFPQAKVTILSRGFAGYAGDLDRAREMGVEIIRYSPEQPPVIGDKTVEVYDQISDMETRIPFDRVVLAVPMLARESNRGLAKILRIPTDEFGFLVEPHLKVRPEEYAPRGIFIAGCAHWPSTITECIVQGYGAASRAFDLINTGKVERYATVTKVDDELCRGCGRCEEVCQHGAIELVSDPDGMQRARVVAIQCVGCGVCVSACPSGALSLGDMSSRQAALTIEAAGGH